MITVIRPIWRSLQEEDDDAPLQRILELFKCILSDTFRRHKPHKLVLFDHLEHYLCASDKLLLDVNLREAGPIAVVLKPLFETFVFQNVELSEFDLHLEQTLHQDLAGLALRIGCVAAHEDYDRCLFQFKVDLVIGAALLCAEELVIVLIVSVKGLSKCDLIRITDLFECVLMRVLK